MASSGNFPLWSPLIKGATNLSLGSTRFDGSTNSKSAATSFAVPIGTKFYVECLVKQLTNYNIVFGLVSADQAIDTYLESQSSINGFIFHGYNASNWYTQALVNGSRQGFSSNVGLTSARVLAMTINRVDHEIKCYLDNSLITNGTISISATEEYRIFASYTGGTNSGVHMNINCGHDSTGAGDFSAGGNADENGFGDFQYSPPSGFLAPSSANLPISDDIDPAGDDGATENPTKQLNVVTYTGNGSTINVTGVGFQPDFVWIKMRSPHSYNHMMFDSNRGVTKHISSDRTASEFTTSNSLTSFDSDGFTYGSELSGNDSGDSFVAWCWKANGGSTSSNTDGSITSTVQANTKAGFSIITYTGNDGSWGSGNRDTFGHGLSKAPEFILVKERNNTDQWTVFHANVGNGGGSNAASNNLVLNSTDALYTNQSYTSWGKTMPTSTLVTVEGNTTNNSGTTHVAYCWHSVEGYSSFGSYVGSGNADGPFIYTGFRPRFVITKGLAVSGWNLRDSARSPNNIVNEVLQADTTSTELTSNYDVLFLSNGFKILATAGDSNTNGNTYAYGAWGDVPFKYNNTF